MDKGLMHGMRAKNLDSNDPENNKAQTKKERFKSMIIEKNERET